MCFFGPPKTQPGSVLQINFSNIEPKGQLLIQVTSEDNSYNLKRVIPAVSHPQLILRDLKSGYYYVRVFHDLNSNNILDKNFLGMPLEPYGFSNNARGVFGPPDVKDMLIDVDGQRVIDIRLE